MFNFPGSGSRSRASSRNVSPLGGRFDFPGSDTPADIRRYDSVRGYPLPAPSSSRTTRERVHRQPSTCGVDLSTLGGEVNPYAALESRRPSRYGMDVDTLGGGAAPFSSSRQSTREHRAHRDRHYQIDDRRHYTERQASTQRHESTVGLDNAFARLHMESRGRRPEYGSSKDRYHSSAAEFDRVQPDSLFSPSGFEFRSPNYGVSRTGSRRQREVSPTGGRSRSPRHTVQARSHGRRYRQDELFFD